VDSLKPWREEFADVKAKYDNYISETGTRKSLSSKRDGMKRRLSEVERELQEATEISGEWKSEWGKAIDIADKLDGALSDRYNARFAKAEDLTKLSEGVLRLSVEEAADSSPATQLLRSVQSGLHSKTLESLAQNVPAHRLALLLLNPNYELTSGIQDDQLEKLRHRVMSLDDRVSVLKALMSAVPEDTPLIEYRKTRSEYAPIEKVSQGQRCTALITLALLEGSAPVIIDQPEDSLDIRAVWDDIAISVRRKKHQRQFIFTTHNSTIAVAADSDCIAVLEPDGARARMTHEGSIDLHRIKESAIQHLEGGPQAYLLRRKKYNISNE